MWRTHRFFDPFSIQKTQQGWHEVMITSGPDPASKTVLKSSEIHAATPKANLDLDTTLPSSHNSGPHFRAVLSPASSPSSTLLGSSSPHFQSMPIGSRIEVSASSFQMARKIGELITGPGRVGSALVIDYGGDHSFGNSFRVSCLFTCEEF